MFTRSQPTGTGPEWQTMHYATADDVTAVRVGDTPHNPYPYGYGAQIPTSVELRCAVGDSPVIRWRRVYVACYGNAESAYVRGTVDGAPVRFYLDQWCERLADDARGVSAQPVPVTPGDLARIVSASHGYDGYDERLMADGRPRGVWSIPATSAPDARPVRTRAGALAIERERFAHDAQRD